MSSTPGPVRVAGVLLVATLLGGCAGLRPGTAVVVGDTTISTSELDATTTQFCAAISEPLDQQAQSIPHGYFRGGIAGTLALQEVAENVAAEQGVEAGSASYLKQISDLRKQVAALPEEQQEPVMDVETAPIYVQEIERAVGMKLLDDPDASDADYDQAGAEELQKWIDEHGVEFDPSLNTSIRDATVTPTDGSLSFAVSEGAKAGLEEQPNSALAAELPDSQRCGR